MRLALFLPPHCTQLLFIQRALPAAKVKNWAPNDEMNVSSKIRMDCCYCNETILIIARDVVN